MAKILIDTDSTLEGTKLTVDGVDVTSCCKVVRLGVYACAPYKSEMMGDVYKGNISVDYTIVNDSGVLESHSYGGCGDHYTGGMGENKEMEGMMEDSLKIKTADQVVQFIGKTIAVEKSNLIDKIITHCETNKLPCPNKDELGIRSQESLMDKVTDLGINLEG